MTLIPYSRQEITQEDVKAVSEVLLSDFLTQGPKVVNFEKALCDLFGVNRATACSSGTSALHLAYAGLGAGPGSIAIVPAITFSATANAMLYAGGDVVFCDVDPMDGLICTSTLSRIVKNKTFTSRKNEGFICPVSMSGKTAPLLQCHEIAMKHDLKTVEDASHSLLSFSLINEGTQLFSASCEYSDAACLRFHPVKHLCCGEGGAVLTNSVKLAEKVNSLRSHGIVRPNHSGHKTPWMYEQRDLGWNYRLSDIHAALGLSQMSRLQKQIEKRRSLAQRYFREFQKPPFVGHIKLPIHDEGHSWHLYVIHLQSSSIRDELHKYLKEKMILTQVHYIPLYRHPYFEQRYGKLTLPGAEQYYKGCLSIPLFPSMDIGQQDLVLEEIANFFE